MHFEAEIKLELWTYLPILLCCFINRNSSDTKGNKDFFGVRVKDQDFFFISTAGFVTLFIVMRTHKEEGPTV